ncbi:MAG: polyprenyl synthetase family protein, partial [Luminiphilus sp.]|nr:polyprenyl synthetase family protein [Luminiphilus sp.]
MALSSNIVCSDPTLEAAAYALANPGKQLRSRLCRETATMVSGETVQSAMRVGEAIECLHTYSLI